MKVSRKSLRSVAALVVLATLALFAWVAAPALTRTPYVAPAVDFEQAVPGGLERLAPRSARSASGHDGHEHGGGGAHEDEGPVSFRTPVLEAPERFDLAGLTDELRHYELRGRDSDGEWSEWVETSDGSPVYFGGADELQVRTRGWRPAGDVHYVNVSGTTSTAGGLLNDARAAINSAYVDVSTLMVASAGAEVTKPGVVSRREWGAMRSNGGCKPRKRPDTGRVKAAAIHHTVSASSYSRAEAPGLVLGICRFHKQGNGWDDIGYNALVDRFGRIYEGRDGGLGRPVVGAHALGFNDQTTGVAALGTYSSNAPSKKMRRGIARFLAWKLDVHDIRPTGKTKLRSGGGDSGINPHPKGKRVGVQSITKHRRLSNTECPGNALNREIKSIQRMTQRKTRAARG